MAVEFLAEEDSNGVISVKAKVEKIGNDTIIHLPSLPLITKLKREFKEKKLKEKQ